MSGAADRLVAAARRLAGEVDALRFGPPVTHVYNPLAYAWAPHEAYLRRYGGGPKEVVLVGMNPGPWGMVQTGIPFGEVAAVRDWMGIEAPVGAPPRPHPRRPVLGFACRRSEVSGRRLWGWARARFGTPDRFFARFFVLNYCPLAFFEAAGANRTPDRLRADERRALFAACDRALREAVHALAPRLVLGVGRFAEARAREALRGLGTAIAAAPHPSPASPQANRGWAPLMDAALGAAGVHLP
ncbi:uracil-DNA glycosylase family protein [Inmirania thermothiophila]|uniref:Single-strand selective monofunctional uracil DNA glycosylase n=1 Tax=Inmirania thermothiophila TaxID=1750597 RepID=A0A3N1Y1S4_9GAMM|nr:uracil-DNA glycosylase family protein [Inmirania thermothiophila]ROR32471.1 single-strand selective monofunctional uracil DNA glycosylase [Inmirania thermothiophila]